MKRNDLYFLAFVIAITLPFFISEQAYSCYVWANNNIPYWLAALKFAVLSTAGEMIGLRIKSGKYLCEGFGIAPRAILWGVYGAWIAMMMKSLAVGVPFMMERLGFEGVSAAMGGDFSMLRLFGAFGISLMMNLTFAPVFMTLHKITDAHIMSNNGSMRALVRPIDMAAGFTAINWQVQWGFVFKRTIPLFWLPAHTITFLLPASSQVLFAALLSIALGVILSVSVVLSRR